MSLAADNANITKRKYNGRFEFWYLSSDLYHKNRIKYVRIMVKCYHILVSNAL